MPEGRRPRDPYMDGTGLRFETMERGGEYPDPMPQAIKLIDAEGRSCIYVPKCVSPPRSCPSSLVPVSSSRLSYKFVLSHNHNDPDIWE